MFAKVHFGYVEGRERTVIDSGTPLYGRMQPYEIRGRKVLELWPHDFPENARHSGSGVRRLAILWDPEYRGLDVHAFLLSGLERCRRGDRTYWHAQRWMICPMSYQDLEREKDMKDPRFGLIPPSPGMGYDENGVYVGRDAPTAR